MNALYLLTPSSRAHPLDNSVHRIFGSLVIEKPRHTERLSEEDIGMLVREAQETEEGLFQSDIERLKDNVSDPNFKRSRVHWLKLTCWVYQLDQVGHHLRVLQNNKRGLPDAARHTSQVVEYTSNWLYREQASGASDWREVAGQTECESRWLLLSPSGLGRLTSFA